MHINNTYVVNKFTWELKNVTSSVKKFIQENVNLIALAVFSALGLLALISYRVYVKKKKAQKLNEQNFKFEVPQLRYNQKPAVDNPKIYKAASDQSKQDPKPSPLSGHKNNLWLQLGNPQTQDQDHKDVNDKGCVVNTPGVFNVVNDQKPSDDNHNLWPQLGNPQNQDQDHKDVNGKGFDVNSPEAFNAVNDQKTAQLPLQVNNAHLGSPLSPQLERPFAQDHDANVKKVVVNTPEVFNVINDPKPVANKPEAHELDADRLKSDPKPAQPPAGESGLWLETAGFDAQDNYNIVTREIKNNPEAFKFASENKRNIRSLTELAVSKNGLLLELAGSRPRNDYQTVLKAIENNPEAFKFASERLKNNRSLTQLAVSKKGLLLELAGPDAQDDYATVKAAIENEPEAFKFASERLKNYPPLVQLVASKK